MSKYRCPLCGAGHKNQADHCRLCGQSMAPGAVSAISQQVAQPVQAQRGMKGMVFIGVGLMIIVVVAAVVFGVVRENSQIRKAKSLVVEEADGWTTQVDDQGLYTVELPGTRTRESTPFAGTDDRKLAAWHAELGSETQVLVGWGKVSPPLTNGALTTPAAYRYLRDSVVLRWMAGNGLSESFVTVEEGGAGGLPSVTVHTTQARLKVVDQDAYAHLTFALNGTTLYVLQVLTIYKDAPQLARMVQSFAVNGTVT
jgi:hypothetical protein